MSAQNKAVVFQPRIIFVDFQLRIIALRISFELFYGISSLNDSMVCQLRIVLWCVSSELCYGVSAHNNAMTFQLRIVL